MGGIAWRCVYRKKQAAHERGEEKKGKFKTVENLARGAQGKMHEFLTLIGYTLFCWFWFRFRFAADSDVVISLNHNWFALRFYVDLCVYNIGKYICIFIYGYI